MLLCCRHRRTDEEVQQEADDGESCDEKDAENLHNEGIVPQENIASGEEDEENDDEAKDEEENLHQKNRRISGEELRNTRENEREKIHETKMRRELEMRIFSTMDYNVYHACEQCKNR